MSGNAPNAAAPQVFPFTYEMSDYSQWPEYENFPMPDPFPDGTLPTNSLFADTDVKIGTLSLSSKGDVDFGFGNIKHKGTPIVNIDILQNEITKIQTTTTANMNTLEDTIKTNMTNMQTNMTTNINTMQEEITNIKSNIDFIKDNSNSNSIDSLAEIVRQAAAFVSNLTDTKQVLADLQADALTKSVQLSSAIRTQLEKDRFLLIQVNGDLQNSELTSLQKTHLENEKNRLLSQIELLEKDLSGSNPEISLYKYAVAARDHTRQDVSGLKADLAEAKTLIDKQYKETKAKITTNGYTVPDTIAVTADADVPIPMELINLSRFDATNATKVLSEYGWYYINETGRKINWYPQSQQIQLKFQDLEALMMDVFFISTVSPLFLTVYVKRNGTESANELPVYPASWYKAKLSYAVNPSELQAFTPYTLIAKLVQDSPDIPLTNQVINMKLSEPISNYKNTNGDSVIRPDDEVFFSIWSSSKDGSNEPIPAGDVEMILRNFVIQKDTGLTVYKFLNDTVLNKYNYNRIVTLHQNLFDIDLKATPAVDTSVLSLAKRHDPPSLFAPPTEPPR